MSFHQLIIVGNLGRDPELRYAPNGNAVAGFTVAANRGYKNSEGEQVKDTVWFRVNAWGRLGETCIEYLKTGSKVLVVGRLNPDKGTGGPRVYARDDGSMGASYEVVASRVTFLTPHDGAPAKEGTKDQLQEEDEIPF